MPAISKAYKLDCGVDPAGGIFVPAGEFVPITLVPDDEEQKRNARQVWTA
jgi:hypothetical protein